MTGDAYALIGATGSGLTSLAQATELAKVPKSDSNVTWNNTALASINAEVDTALNTAIPSSNTANSVNDILLDVLTLAAINAEVDTALNTAIPASNTATSVNDILLDVLTLAAINAEVDTALNTAIPGSPTSDSINERIKAIDDLTQAAGAGDLTAILGDTNELQGEWANGGRLDLILDAASAPSADTVADAVWNEALSGHSGAGSAGLALSTASSGGVDPSVLADAIWDEVISTGHAVSNSAGKILYDNLDATVGSRLAPAGTLAKVTLTDRCTLTDTCTTNTDMRGTNSAALASVCTETRLAELDATNLPADVDNILTDTGTTLDALIKRALGLVEENCKMTSATYSVTGKQTDAIWKIYPTATDCTNDTNAIATYTMTATYDVDDNLATYKVVKS
jgi:hypothetical protein